MFIPRYDSPRDLVNAPSRQFLDVFAPFPDEHEKRHSSLFESPLPSLGFECLFKLGSVLLMSALLLQVLVKVFLPFEQTQEKPILFICQQYFDLQLIIYPLLDGLLVCFFPRCQQAAQQLLSREQKILLLKHL